MPSRNGPCSCGSGKKYKKCCLTKDEAARATQAGSEAGGRLCAVPPELREEVDRLDEWANGARDALKAGRFEEVERLCGLLEKEYADVSDPYDITGRMREVQGRWAEAAEAYERAVALVEAQGPEWIDEEFVRGLREARERARKRAAGSRS